MQSLEDAERAAESQMLYQADKYWTEADEAAYGDSDGHEDGQKDEEEPCL